jgi:hypothetical protein
MAVVDVGNSDSEFTSDPDLAFLASTQTLTNKTLTSPIMGTQITLDQSTADYTFTWANPSSARAISISDPGGTDVFAWVAATQTLTNKTLTSPTLNSATLGASSITLSQSTANYTLSWADPASTRTITIADPGGNDTFAYLAATQTLSGKTVTGLKINDTSANHTYTIGVSELSADRTATLPLLTGTDTFVFNAFAATLTNKSINLANNTLTGTLAEFNSAISNGSIAQGDLLADGSVALSANWDVGSFTITALKFTSDQATGTAPFTVSSTTVVSNLNADLLDGVQGSGYALTSRKLDDMGTPDDNTDLDVSTSRHGLVPKAPNDTAKFLRGDATWNEITPPGSTLIATAAASSNEYNFSSLSPTGGAPLFLYIAGGETSTDDDDIMIQFNGVTSSSYRFGAHGHSDAGGTGAWSSMGAAHIAIIGENGSTNSVGNAAGEQFHAAIWISNTHDANEFMCSGRSWWLSAAAQAYEASVIGHADLGSATGITAIKVFAGGNIDAGVAYLYELAIA